MPIDPNSFSRFVATGNLERVKAALNDDFDPMTRGRAATRAGHTYLYLAAKNGHPEIVKLLLEKYPLLINESCLLNKTALFDAATTCIPPLLQYGINIFHSSEGGTALFSLIKAGNAAGVELLLAHVRQGESARQIDEYMNILSLPNVIRFIVQRYYDSESLINFVNMTPERGLTPLAYALNLQKIRQIKEDESTHENYNKIIDLLMAAKAETSVNMGNRKISLIQS